MSLKYATFTPEEAQHIMECVRTVYNQKCGVFKRDEKGRLTIDPRHLDHPTLDISIRILDKCQKILTQSNAKTKFL